MMASAGSPVSPTAVVLARPASWASSSAVCWAASTRSVVLSLESAEWTTKGTPPITPAPGTDSGYTKPYSKASSPHLTGAFSATLRTV